MKNNTTMGKYGVGFSVLFGLCLVLSQTMLLANTITLTSPSSNGATSIDGIDGVIDFLQGTDPGECGRNAFHWSMTANGASPVTISCTSAGQGYSPDALLDTLNANGSDAYTTGGNFPVGTNTVKCTVTDSGGGQAQRTFRVIVVDTEPPVTSTPASAAAEATPGTCSAPVYFNVSVFDQCPASQPAPGCPNCPAPTVTCTYASGVVLPVGTYNNVCVGTDLAGNTHTKSFPIIVTDQQSPIVTVDGTPNPASDTQINRTIPCGGTASIAVSANDNCDGGRTVVCTDSQNNVVDVNALPVGAKRLYCTATDLSGNANQVSFVVVVTALSVGNVIWHAPIADGSAPGPGSSHSDIPGIYTFKAGSTIPVEIHTVGCDGVDNTASVDAFVDVVLIDQISGNVIADLPEDYSGIGEPGGMMDHINGHLKYNLKTTGYESGTASNTHRFKLTVTVGGYSESIYLESK